MSTGGGVALVILSLVFGFLGFVLFPFAIFFWIFAFIMLVVGIILIALGNPKPQTTVVYAHAQQPSYPPPYQPTPPSNVGVAERYCPSCGAGNLRASGYCHKCGQPLPAA